MAVLAKDLFEELAPHVGDSGVCPDDSAAIIKDLNEVVPMLIKRMDSLGSLPQWCVPAVGGCFALPPDCLEVRTILLDGFPLVQRDQWYQGKLGIGLLDGCVWRGANCNQNSFIRTCNFRNVIDLGDDYAIPLPWPNDSNGKLGLKAENDADASAVVQVDILNEYGDVIRNDISLSRNQQIAISDSFVRDIPFIRKPVTKGNVIGYYVCPNGRTEKLFTIAPRVVTPKWRRKKLPTQFPCGRHGTILIRGKIRFTPLISEDDVVIMDDVKALQFGCRALAAMKRDDRVAYNENLALAVNELNMQLNDASSNAVVSQASVVSPFGRAAKTKSWS